MISLILNDIATMRWWWHWIISI